MTRRRTTWRKHSLETLLERFKGNFPLLAVALQQVEVEMRKGVGVVAVVDVPKSGQKAYRIQIDLDQFYQTCKRFFDNSFVRRSAPSFGYADLAFSLILIHELLHILLNHFKRAPSDLQCFPTRCETCLQSPCHRLYCFRVAADLAINPLLLDYQLFAERRSFVLQCLPAMLPEQFQLPDYQTLEFYYQALKDTSKPSPQSSSDQGSGEHSPQSSSDQGSGHSQDAGDDQQQDASPNSESQAPSPSDPSSASAQTQLDCVFQIGDDIKSLKNVLTKTADTKSWIEQEAFRKTVKEMAEKVREVSVKGVGIHPGTEAFMVSSILPDMGFAKTDWKSLLNSALANVGVKLNKRYKKFAIDKRYQTVPGLVVKPQNHVLIAIDTSGSISNLACAKFREYVNQNFVNLCGDAWIVECDTKIHNVFPLGSGIPARHIFKGRGGTDFTEPIRLALKEGFQCLLYLTDGDGYVGMSSRSIQGLKIFWLLYGHDQSPYLPARSQRLLEYGKVIILDQTSR